MIDRRMMPGLMWSALPVAACARPAKAEVLTEDNSLSVRVELADQSDSDAVRLAIGAMLLARFNIQHPIIQLERGSGENTEDLHR